MLTISCLRKRIIETVIHGPNLWNSADLSETLPIANRRELTAGIRVAPQTGSFFTLHTRAISMASRTVSVFKCVATRHPTMVLEKASTIKHERATPAQVATNVKSVTDRRLGAVAVKSWSPDPGVSLPPGTGNAAYF